MNASVVIRPVVLNAGLVQGQTVMLVFDVQQRDRFGRLLAYVYVGDLFINAELVRRGVAEVATFPPNVLHRDEFIALQRQAMAANAGLWGDTDARPHYRPRGSGVYGNERLRTFFHIDDPGRHVLWQDEWVGFDSADEASKAGYQASMNFAQSTPTNDASSPGVTSTGTAASSGGAYSGSGVVGGTGSNAGTDVKVRGYTRSDGSYVAPYTQSAPGTGGGGRR